MIEIKPKNVTSLVRQVRGCIDETQAVQIVVDYEHGCTLAGFKLGLLIGLIVGVAIGALGLVMSVSI
jgi:hypothetical protein